MSGRNLTIALLAVLALFIASNSLFIIKETERGVLLRFGEVVPMERAPKMDPFEE